MNPDEHVHVWIATVVHLMGEPPTVLLSCACGALERQAMPEVAK
jgi:hypothetical protein